MKTMHADQRDATMAVEVFFDGDCPLCRREVAFLRRRDKGERIVAVDIAGADFDASAFDRSHSEFMATIQGRLSDGRWISGVEVFRQLYAAVGFTRLVKLSRLGPIDWLLRLSYDFFAKHRLRITGRCSSSACTAPRTAANDNQSRSTSPVPASESAATKLTDKTPAIVDKRTGDASKLVFHADRRGNAALPETSNTRLN